jgi:hypothetical protein
MFGRRMGFLCAGMVLLGPSLLLSTVPARAVVYCARPGYPVGCVVRRPARMAVATPGLGAPGVGVAPRPAAGGVGVVPGAGAGAPGAGVAPANRGGPVNRAGLR